MTITARYPARCARCRQPIAVGSQINWSRGVPATHAGTCPPAAQIVTALARAYGTAASLADYPQQRYGRTGSTFTCSRCGDHRDTTLAGHCDDCEA
jgi:hypothetical protein